MAQRIFQVAGIVLAAMVVTACDELTGGGTLVPVTPGNSPGNVATGNACSLVSADEVWGITSSDKLVAFQNPQIASRCDYATSTTTGSGVASVTWTPTGGEKRFEALRADSASGLIDGIGDEAFQDDGRLIFRLGDQSFDVQVQWGGNDADQAAAVVIAKVIIARATGQPVPAGLIPTPPPALATKDPCKLLSNEEAAVALQVDPLTSYNNDAGGSNQPIFCFYSYPVDGTAVLTTYLDPKGGFDTFDATLAGMDVQPIEGLGDKAAFVAYSGDLYVLYGDTILKVSVYTSKLGSVLEADRAIMEILLSRIKVP